MTPKIKANELYTYYINVIKEIGGELVKTKPVLQRAKECAFFTANQCKKEIEDDYFYWEEVEKEIQNFKI